MILLILYELIATLQVRQVFADMPILPEDIHRKCEMYRIMPTLVDKIPNHAVEVMFGDGILVEFGNEIDERECQEEPNVMWPIGSNDTYYTLIMTDPDNPTRADATNREFQHWVVGNIPGTHEDRGEELTPWYPPHPIRSCGLHRYTFLLYLQPAGKKVHFDEPILNYSTYGRAHFKTKKFAKKYNLGDPVAINFFLAESYEG